MKSKCLLLALTLLLASLNACKDRKQADFSEYISGYTTGMIKSASPVRIFLNRKPDRGFRTGSTLPADILKISPEMKGETVLKEDYSIEFIPSEPFRNGQTYRAELDLGKICRLPEQYGKFAFQFEILPLTLLFETGELTVEANDENALQYKGTLHSSDQIEAGKVEKTVSADYQGASLSPEWEHHGNRHDFRFRHLVKTAKSGSLTLHFTKEVKNNANKDIIIPGNQELTVLDVRLSDSDPAVLSIYLSENIAPDQDIRGLVNLQGIKLENFKIRDNLIQAYLPSSVENGTADLSVFPGIRSTSGHTLSSEYMTTLHLRSTKPEVRLIGKGVIVPDTNKVVLPFAAVGLKAVDLEIIQVLGQNMNFFLQENSYDEYYQLMQTARPVFMKKIDLTKNCPRFDPGKWNHFTINLSDLVKLEKGTVYRIRLKFRKSYTTLPCADELPDSDYGTTDWDNANGYSYYSEYYYPRGYRWEERENPCSISYYTEKHFAGRNLINTSLGLMAKQGSDNRYVICVTDLATAAAVSGCQVTLYNYQNQEIASAQTDKNGFAELCPDGKAFILMAQKEGDRAWLKLSDGNALSLSNFDVSGQHVQMGVKGFIYGERGVWRPGDKIHLSLILEDKLGTLPQGHPITAQLTDPHGHIAQILKDSIGKNNIHCFAFKTAEDAPTGYWNALFRIGGLTFRQTLRIETVKPNRLAIRMEFPNEKIIGKGISSAPIKVSTRWLNGAATSKQKASTEIRLYNGNSGFSAYPDYSFTNKSRHFEPATQNLFKGSSDSSGAFAFSPEQIKTDNAPGLLNAVITTRIFENGGDFSTASQSLLYSPYTAYVGIRLPRTEDNWYSTESPVRLSGVCITPNGKNCNPTTVHIDVYRLEWHWWWDAEDEQLSSYINRKYSKSVLSKEVKTKDGNFNTDLKISEYGRYFIRATHPSGHTSGLIAWFGSWGTNAGKETATMLHLSTDKKSYRVGEKIRVTFPSDAGTAAVMSLENGKNISDIRRIPTNPGSTTFEFEATSEMCPNTYAAISLFQAHNRHDNDRPVRMYGVVNIPVEDPDLRLEPEIRISPDLRPGEKFSIKVSEKKGRAMNYTIAVIDEGLLSLTSFRTPEPFNAFYAREALGVKTWDFYDYIYGAYGARLDKAFAVGGDEYLKTIQAEKTNRFKPVVLFDGPFSIEAGKSGGHTFKMPEYTGEVRTMVIAAGNGRYGSAEATSKVSKPLMLSVALPRLLTPGDTVDIPVTVFAMKDRIRDVIVNMKTDRKISLPEGNSREIHFDGKGEKVVYFKAGINMETGTSTLSTEAYSGNERTRITEDVKIRIPNPRITRIEEKEAEPGKTVSLGTAFTGIAPSSVLEISSIPPLNLEHRLNELLDYPHGCSEQITSQAFPQLSLPVLTALTPEQSIRTEEHVREVIDRLCRYQTGEGGFSYWPGGNTVSEWVTSYVIQFLITARQQGYTVPAQTLQKALHYSRQTANNWNCSEARSQQEQAYRLFVLALAGSADLAAMNRLKEAALQRPVSVWLLAAAYALSHQENIAGNMIRGLSSEIPPYRETGGNYGSDTRDQALILQAMIILNKQQDARRMLEKLSAAMGSEAWYNTQETAFSLHAAAEFVRKYLGSQDGIQVTVTVPEGKKEIRTDKTVWQLPLSIRNGQAGASVQNNGRGGLFVRQISSSASLDVVTEKVMSGLSMEVRYLDGKGRPADLLRLKQGEDITTEITVRNTGVTGTYRELALSYLLPSGFELINERLYGNNALPEAENTDIRDDRFYVYFSLEQNRSKTFRFRSNAAFRGEYMLPAIECSAMYDNGIRAIWPGGKVRIGL